MICVRQRLHLEEEEEEEFLARMAFVYTTVVSTRFIQNMHIQNDIKYAVGIIRKRYVCSRQ